MPNSAPGLPVATCFGATTPCAGDTSNIRLVGTDDGDKISPLPTTRLPLSSSAALIGALNWPPDAITVACFADGPENVGTAVGGLAEQSLFATTPSLPSVEMSASAITPFELLSTTYSVSIPPSYVRP